MAEKIARALGKTWSLIALAVFFCALPLLVPVDYITYVLSVLALSICQLVLLVQFNDKDRDAARDCAMHAKLDEILKAIPQASNELIGSEKEKS